MEFVEIYKLLEIVNRKRNTSGHKNEIEENTNETNKGVSNCARHEVPHTDRPAVAGLLGGQHSSCPCCRSG